MLSPNLADLELLRLESGLAIVRLRLRAAGSCPADMKGLFASLPTASVSEIEGLRLRLSYLVYDLYWPYISSTF